MFINFITVVSPLPSLGAMVLATGATSPTEVLAEVTQDLLSKHVTGPVLFDLLLAHGNTANRYFLREFDGEYFDAGPFQSAIARYAEFSDISAKLLYAHIAALDLSLLLPVRQYAVRQGLAL